MKRSTLDPSVQVHRTRRFAGALTIAGAILLSACSGSTSTASSPASTTLPVASSATGDSAPSSGEPVLPVTTNPIDNTSTNEVLTIDSVLVENNVDPISGAVVDDHLEISITNTGSADVGGFEVFYTYEDPTLGISESYYSKLPDSFTIAAGAVRVAHFDNTGAVDHFPVNAYSVFYTNVNALDVTVIVSATDAAMQTVTVQKDPGGAETAD